MQLWYLIGCVWALLVIYICLKHNLVKILYFIAVLLYGGNVILSTYTPLLPGCIKKFTEESYIWELFGEHNGILFGMIYLCVGILLAHRAAGNIKSIVAGLTVSLCLYTVEYVFVCRLWGRCQVLYFTMPFVTYYLVAALLCIPCSIRGSILTHIRKLTAFMFYLHTWIICAVNAMTEFMGNQEDMSLWGNHFLFFVTVFALTMICSEVIMYLERFGNIAFLKKLYS